MTAAPSYPGIRITTNGNQLLGYYTEPLIADAGVFYPITPSTEQGENFQLSFAKGQLNAFGESFLAIEAEGEHAAQGGATAAAVTGKRVSNFTSGQGVVYALEQYYHAPGKLCTMVLQIAARALTKHALNVHCGHDDVYAAMDTGWIVLFGKDAQQASDQSIILRRVTELALNPGMNVQDGFLTSHVERTFRAPEPGLIREFLGHPADEIPCPTEAQRELFGPSRRRVPKVIDLRHPQVVGPVQNQEHYMNGVAARRNHFSEPILGMLEEAYEDFARLTGRRYGLLSCYRCEDADTVLVALGSAAENIEAAVDHLRSSRGDRVGVIHVNVIRPFPEAAMIEALRGKQRVIVLERSDDPLSGDNLLTRDIRNAIAKACDNFAGCRHSELPTLNPATERPDIFSGVYGLGSRDFRPENIIGAVEFASGAIARQDGRSSSDGTRFFYLGIDHPYAVISTETPSLLPEDAIAVRLHSIGGWGMITTGKNLGEIIGTLSQAVAERDDLREPDGSPQEVVHVSANPKYGSEKKGAPTSYFLVAAPERVRVNCDLRHVDVVLCCDPKAFLHCDPLNGLRPGGAFVIESGGADAAGLWELIPPKARSRIIADDIRVYGLDGFVIARGATKRVDLQLRMQGNAFLGAFFAISGFLDRYRIGIPDFLASVEAQYQKKFGRFGAAVISANMDVMKQGLEGLIEVPHRHDAPDRSSFSSEAICPVSTNGKSNGACSPPLFSKAYFDREYRAGLGYDQPASPLASVGVVAAATGLEASKYVSRRQVPVWLTDNCTQCLDCITVCPDTALPNTAQDLSNVLRAAIRHYVDDSAARTALEAHVIPLAQAVRKGMKAALGSEQAPSFAELAIAEMERLAEQDPAVTSRAVAQVAAILEVIPCAYRKTRGIFELLEKKREGDGGVFSIIVSDLCKGCGACVEACGDRQALVMADETFEMHGAMESANRFLNLLPETPQRFLGKLDSEHVEDAKAATLRYHLMLRSKYASLLSGDGACAGCGEKGILRAVASLTESLMRPIFHRKAERLRSKAAQVSAHGLELLAAVRQKDPEAYQRFVYAVLTTVMGYGGSNQADAQQRIDREWTGGDREIVDGLRAILEQEAHDHRDLRTIEGMTADGMCAMAMTAHTGCNSVFGSTPPNNPHPYPWMNSLFQDGTTIGWLIGESFIQDHARRSVVPERLVDHLLGELDGFSADHVFRYARFSDTYMTDAEVMELPRVWAIGGDGGMGDIGFQNVSKVILQNRPNVQVLMLNTQVYSNTGGQNSESSVMTGGFDMNQIGPATEGKLTEMKSVAESLLGGHGSAFIAQVSLANTATLFRTLLDGLCYRGTAYFQVYAACMPEHGIPDDAAQRQAIAARDSRCVPEFVFDPSLGETYQDCLSLKGNTDRGRDWMQKRVPDSKEKYAYTVAHWAFTEARFRNHHKRIKAEDLAGKERLEQILERLTMNDIVHRRFLDPEHPAFIPDFGVYAVDYGADGKPVYQVLSRQMVIFCVERRRAWRMLQSRASVPNDDYQAQRQNQAASEPAPEIAV